MIVGRFIRYRASSISKATLTSGVEMDPSFAPRSVLNRSSMYNTLALSRGYASSSNASISVTHDLSCRDSDGQSMYRTPMPAFRSSPQDAVQRCVLPLPTAPPKNIQGLSPPMIACVHDSAISNIPFCQFSPTVKRSKVNSLRNDSRPESAIRFFAFETSWQEHRITVFRSMYRQPVSLQISQFFRAGEVSESGLLIAAS